MSQNACACHQFEKIQGAAVQAWRDKFLTPGPQPDVYCCRVCGTQWQKVQPAGEKRATLIRLANAPDSSFQGKSV